MFARNVSIHLKPNMLSITPEHLRRTSFLYFVNRMVSRTKSPSRVPAVQMSLQSVCGTTKPMQRLTTQMPTQKC